MLWHSSSHPISNVGSHAQANGGPNAVSDQPDTGTHQIPDNGTDGAAVPPQLPAAQSDDINSVPEVQKQHVQHERRVRGGMSFSQPNYWCSCLPGCLPFVSGPRVHSYALAYHLRVV